MWGLALAPCLVVPPVFAVLLAWRGQGSGPRHDATWVTIVAIFNIVLSLVVIVRFGREALVLLEAWQAFWRWHPPSQQPRLTPI